MTRPTSQGPTVSGSCHRTPTSVADRTTLRCWLICHHRNHAGDLRSGAGVGVSPGSVRYTLTRGGKPRIVAEPGRADQVRSPRFGQVGGGVGGGLLSPGRGGGRGRWWAPGCPP